MRRVMRRFIKKVNNFSYKVKCGVAWISGCIVGMLATTDNKEELVVRMVLIGLSVVVASIVALMVLREEKMRITELDEFELWLKEREIERKGE